MDDIRKTFSPDFLIVIGIAVGAMLVLLRGGWIEPDSFGFFSMYCGHGTSIDVPFLSNIFFTLIPCDIGSWVIVQSALWLFFFMVFVHVMKKYHGVEYWESSIIGLSLGFIYSVLAIEDDFIALPLIVYGYWSLQSKKYLRGVLSLIIATFFWKGANLIGAIAVTQAINPLLGLTMVGGYILTSGFDTWGGSIEAFIGYGLVALIGFLFILYFAERERIRVFRSHRVFVLTIPFIILALYQAKWSLYPILFLPVWFKELIQDVEMRKTIAWVAGFIMLISVVGIQLTKEPGPNEWALIDRTVQLQKDYVVVNEWFVGRWLEYRGGYATDIGGYHGFQDANNAYWLGKERSGCVRVESVGLLTLQKCGEPSMLKNTKKQESRT